MAKLLATEVRAPGDPGHITDHELIARLLNEGYGVNTYTPAAGATVHPDVGAGGTHVVTLPASGAVTIGAATTSDSATIQQWQAGQEIELIVVQGGTATVVWDASWGVSWQPDAVSGSRYAYRFRNVGASGASGPTWRLVSTSCASGIGTAAGRPAPGSVPAGFIYCATDTNAGTPYRSDGTNWTKIGAAIGDAAGQELAYAEITSPFSLATLDGTFYIVPGLSVSVPAGRAFTVECGGEILAGIASLTANQTYFFGVAITDGTTVVTTAYERETNPNATTSSAAVCDRWVTCKRRIPALSLPATYYVYATGNPNVSGLLLYGLPSAGYTPWYISATAH